MLIPVDDFILDRIFQPVVDQAAYRFRIDSLTLATSTLIGSAVIIVLALLSPFPIGWPERIDSLFPAVSLLYPYWVIASDIRTAPRIRRVGVMNELRIRSRARASRIFSLLLFVSIPSLLPVLLDSVPEFRGPIPVWQASLNLALFLGLFTAAQYFLACSPPPPGIGRQRLEESPKRRFIASQAGENRYAQEWCAVGAVKRSFDLAGGVPLL
jgi:hypothetical protein